MSVDQADVIDIISFNRLTGAVALTISDHLDWIDSEGHQFILQSKLNRYMAFVESGELLEHIPNAKERPVVFVVAFKFTPDDGGRAFLVKARRVIEDAGFSLTEEFHPEASFN